MKTLHRPDCFSWSAFQSDRNIDFNGFLWVRPEGNVAIDPMPLSSHDQQHLTALGGLKAILLSNSDHIRSAVELAQATGAEIYGPAGEQGDFPIACQHWLADGEAPFEGLRTLALSGSKTPGELAFLLDETTLFCGDLVRSHNAGGLTILPPEKLQDAEAAKASVRRLANLPNIQAVLVGDGWSVFRHGGECLRDLAQAL
jgi:glyoxylase-like metal-dependent hydrolase (beta-lactamase superfamily II)